jgi:hypothetical protein
MVLHLVSKFISEGISNFSVFVVSTDEVKLHQVILLLETCLHDFKDAIASKVQVLSISMFDIPIEMQFHFIEYNGGLSKDPDYENSLSHLKQLLHPKYGILSVTFFSNNSIFADLRQLRQNQNFHHMIPFSLEPSRLIKQFLKLQELEFLVHDNEIVQALGSEIPASRPFQSLDQISVPSRNWRIMDIPIAEAILTTAGFEIISCLPLICNPSGL